MLRLGIIGFGQQGRLYASILTGWTGQEVTLPCSNVLYNQYLDEKIHKEELA